MGDRIEKGNHNQRPAAQTGSAKLTRSSLCLCGFVVLFTVAIPLWAQQSKVYRDGNSWVEEMTGTLPVTRDVHVTTDLGSVQVQGGSPRITYLVRKRSYAPTEKDARKQFEQMRISAVKNGETDLIQGRIVGRAMMRFGAEFILQVPRDLNVVRVETRGGSLAFTSIAANIVASTGAGLIKLDDLAGPVKIVSGGGNIEGGNLGNDFSVTSGAADVRVANVGGQTQVNLGGGRVYIGSSHASTIQTGAGSIQIQKCMGDLRVTSGGGNLYLGDVEGSVTAETQGGSVRLASATGAVSVTTGGGSVELFRLGRGAQVETGAGPIMVEFVGNRSLTNSFLHTASGDVNVCLSANEGVSVHAQSDMASGRGILTDFPGLNVTWQGGQYSPRSVWVEGAINGGGPTLRIRTTIGQIALRHCQ
jgi:DUF4097 and DUF4098 domain-containing protein YvlB